MFEIPLAGLAQPAPEVPPVTPTLPALATAAEIAEREAPAVTEWQLFLLPNPEWGQDSAPQWQLGYGNAFAHFNFDVSPARVEMFLERLPGVTEAAVSHSCPGLQLSIAIESDEPLAELTIDTAMHYDDLGNLLDLDSAAIAELWA